MVNVEAFKKWYKGSYISPAWEGHIEIVRSHKDSVEAILVHPKDYGLQGQTMVTIPREFLILGD